MSASRRYGLRVGGVVKPNGCDLFAMGPEDCTYHVQASGCETEVIVAFMSSRADTTSPRSFFPVK